MELILNLPSPMVRSGETYEYEPSDYYSELDIQVHEFLIGCLREQFYKSNDSTFRRDLLVYMRRHNLPIFKECYEDVHIF